MRTLELFHTSNSQELELDFFHHGHGGFDGWIFALDGIVRDYGTNVFMLEVNEDEVIEAGQIFYQESNEALDKIVSSFANINNLTEEEAMEILGEETMICEIAKDAQYDEDAAELLARIGLDMNDWEAIAEFSWKTQVKTAECGKALGYSVVAITDENNTSYMIDLNKHINNIKRVK